MAPVLGVSLAFTMASAPALSGEPWIAPGEVRVRHDVQFLVDSGVIDLPITYWPIATSDLANALDGAADRKPAGKAPPAVLTAAQTRALQRLRRLASEGEPSLALELAAAARPAALRTFEATPREEGEATASFAGFFGDRYGGRLEATLVSNPDDGKTARLDGSYAAVKLGNWIVTAGAQERWWGSGWEGSLILSNNARPVPAIALDRAVSKPFESRWLNWIGPWRLTTFVGRMEGERDDFANPVLFGMRIAARPLDGLELSVDRTAQLCGEGRSCGLDDFWNMFTGHDNVGENVAAEDEPGNQLASYELRWASPIGKAPYAVYLQHTGESIDNDIPRPYRSLDLAGAEVWGGSGSSGASWRAGVEWAQTRCGGTQNGRRLWDCAYNNTLFTDGYRYYGRPLGHAMDGDGVMYSARFVRVDGAGNVLSAVARFAEVNRGGAVPDRRHSIAPGPEDWASIDVSHRRVLGPGYVQIGVGIDQRDREWQGSDTTLARIWASWTVTLD